MNSTNNNIYLLLKVSIILNVINLKLIIFFFSNIFVFLQLSNNAMNYI